MITSKIMTHDATNAPKYLVVCGGISDTKFFMTKKKAEAHVRVMRDMYRGSGIFPTIVLMETKILIRKEVDMEF